jgi:hypothetical protein
MLTKGYLWVSPETYGANFYPNSFYGFAFLAVHDYDNYLTDSDFSLEGEMTAKPSYCESYPQFRDNVVVKISNYPGHKRFLKTRSNVSTNKRVLHWLGSGDD